MDVIKYKKKKEDNYKNEGLVKIILDLIAPLGVSH